MNDNIFDRVAKDYEKIHNQSLPPGVQSRSFILQRAAHAVKWILSALGDNVFYYLDFGCGNGRMLECLLKSEELGPHVDKGRIKLFGFDTSSDSIQEAQKLIKSPLVVLTDDFDQLPGNSCFDLVLSCHVFHHIPVKDRGTIAAGLFQKIRPGGRLVIWEHNPLNPLTRLLVSTCPFDKDARLLMPATVRNLFTNNCFEYEDSAHVNLVPPQWIKSQKLAALERALLSLPIGAQYWMRFARPGQKIGKTA